MEIKMTKIRKIKRDNGMTELRREIRRDIKLALLGCSLVVPFVFLGLIIAPLWAWAIWWGWVALLLWVNWPEDKPRKKKRFEHFEIEEDDAA